MFKRVARRSGACLLGAAALVACFAAPASAQVAVTGGVDVTNQYSFRGIRQNYSGASIWPYIDFGGTLTEGDGALKTVTLNAGTWNAFHTNINEDDFTNTDGEPTGNKWYESDIYATLGLGFGGGVTLATTYTSYTSPAKLFFHVKELAFKVSVDDSAKMGKGALKPYGLVAFELDENGADGVGSQGIYIELGVAPGYAGSKASVAFPIKVGLSGKDYYEFGTGDDSTFGYFSAAGIVTVPMGAHANIHGGLEVQAFGDNVKAYNGFGDDPDDPSGSAVIGSIGLGFAF